MGSCGLQPSDSEEGPVAGCCERGNELSCCVSAGNFLTTQVTVRFQYEFCPVETVPRHSQTHMCFVCCLFPLDDVPL
jgi:hypothetical protein